MEVNFTRFLGGITLDPSTGQVVKAKSVMTYMLLEWANRDLSDLQQEESITFRKFLAIDFDMADGRTMEWESGAIEALTRFDSGDDYEINFYFRRRYVH